ncbi:MAG: hypothetical protein KZQ98_18815 [Candidatus Thiodiazotropha sp. (ex Lucinoma borealis)]|nr:hypothetical protein [Candidatus Thiodiazotropha sp. (ex Lucinoma borealis)]
MNIESFCADLDAHLKSEFAYKRRITVSGLGSTLDASRKELWLYFRYPTDDYLSKETLVIAVFFFREKRKGHGTRLIAFLASIAHKYNYRFIYIENIGELSRAFALKHGFELYTPTGYASENAIIEVDEFRRRLSASAPVVDQ